MVDKESFYYHKLQLEQNILIKEKEIEAGVHELMRPETWLSAALYQKVMSWRTMFVETANVINNVVQTVKGGQKTKGFWPTALTALATIRSSKHVIHAIKSIYDRLMHKK